MRILGLRTHFINDSSLDRGTDGASRWRFPWHGRFYVSWGGESARASDLRVEWSWWYWRGLGIGVEVDPGGDERMVGAHVHLLWWSLYFGADTRWLRPRIYRLARPYEYSIGFWALSDDLTLRFSLGGDPDSWSSKDPWYYQWHLNIPDAIFGRAVYTELDAVEPFEGPIMLPEGVCTVTGRLLTAEWRRPRWPWVWRRMRRAEMTPYAANGRAGIPIPGKGESEWDCGEDATYSMTVGAETPGEALAKLRASVLERRERHGGKNWLPAGYARSLSDAPVE